jgi:transposase-like protein
MMTKKRRQYDAQYKFRVALEAAKGNKTINELASETGVHPNQIGAWKRQLLENGAELFSRNGSSSAVRAEGEGDGELYEQIGRLKMELEWLKKKVAPFQ